MASDSENRTAVRVAWITGAFTIVAAIIAGVFAVVASDGGNPGPASTKGSNESSATAIPPEADTVDAAPAEQTTTPAEPTGEFANLNNGQELDLSVPDKSQYASYIAQGTVQDVSSKRLLCIVRDEESNHFVHEVQVANGQWSATVGLGQAVIERPRGFTLILATTTQAASAEIDSIKAQDPDRYYDYGIGRQLPTGVNTLATITIIRVR